jgi:hypothetical protein
MPSPNAKHIQTPRFGIFGLWISECLMPSLNTNIQTLPKTLVVLEGARKRRYVVGGRQHGLANPPPLAEKERRPKEPAVLPSSTRARSSKGF